MFKKLTLVGVVALAVTSVASANGFYVGADLGATRLHAKDSVSGTSTNTGTDTNYTLSSNNTHNDVGIDGGLLAGYAWTYPNQFYLGAEVFTNATSAKVSDKYQDTAGVNYSNNLKLRYTYGVRVLPGYAVTPSTTAYGIVGVVRGNFKVEDTANNALATQMGNSTYTLNGYQLGVGAMTDLSNNIALRGDLTYTGYQNKTINWTDSSGTIQGSGNNKFQASTMDANVAVMYKFG